MSLATSVIQRASSPVPDRRLGATVLFLAVFLLAAVLLPAAPASAQAQDRPRTRVVLAGGPTLNDLELGGTLWLGAVALELAPAGGPFVFDGSIRYARYTAAEREHLLLGELSAQLELSVGPFAPFIGGGGGLAVSSGGGETDAELVAHGTAGARVWLGSALHLRLEARIRSLEPLADATFGLGLAIP